MKRKREAMERVDEPPMKCCGCGMGKPGMPGLPGPDGKVKLMASLKNFW